jgi:hypothetical protein
MEHGVEQIRVFQERQLGKLLDLDRLGRLEEQQFPEGDDLYGLHAYMNDLRAGIWRELSTSEAIDIHRRNLQRSYLDALERLLDGTLDSSGPKSGDVRKQSGISASEIGPAALRQAMVLRKELTASVQRYPEGVQRSHIQFAIHRLDMMLELKH